MTSIEELYYLIGRLVSLKDKALIEPKDLYFVRVIQYRNPCFNEIEPDTHKLYDARVFDNEDYIEPDYDESDYDEPDYDEPDYDQSHYNQPNYNEDHFDDYDPREKGENPYYNELADMDQQSEEFWSWF